MEVKKDLIGKKSPHLEGLAKKHGVSVNRLRRQLELGTKVEKEHTRSSAAANEIARDHLKELPDYYSRLKKMEKEGERAKTTKKGNTQNMGEDVGRGETSGNPDILELLHRANAARIRKGAAEGKFWLLRSEDVMDRKELIKRIIETTTTANIGGFNKPFAGGGDFSSSDPAFGGRNRFNKKQLRFAVKSLLARKSVPSPSV